jgi:ATP-dependent protease ClpP protease subunit
MTPEEAIEYGLVDAVMHTRVPVPATAVPA